MAAKADTADERKRFGFAEKLASGTQNERDTEKENGQKEKEIPLQVCTGTLISVISPLKTNFLLILLIFHRLLYILK